MAEETYRALDEYSRIVETQIITELGVYKEDETPEDYGGFQLSVEVVHSVFLFDNAGQVQKLSFEIKEAMDKDDKIGGPVNLDGVEIKEGGGDEGSSEVPTELVTEVLDTSDEDIYPKNLIDRVSALIAEYD